MNENNHINFLLQNIPIFWINLERAERRRKILEWIAIGVLVLVVGGFIIGLIYLWLNRGY